jgi:hypothetical protein
MTDLDSALRAKLAGFDNDACLGGCGCEDSRCDVTGFDKMRGALTAVLDLHKPRIAVEGPHEGSPICDECSDGTDEFLARDYPCPTVRAIAKEPGVEVT